MSEVLKLPPHPKLAGLGELHRAIREKFASNQDIVFDASEVSSLPIGYVQLILSSAKTATAKGKTMTLMNPSFPCLFAFESIGISPDKGYFQIGYGTC